LTSAVENFILAFEDHYSQPIIRRTQCFKNTMTPFSPEVLENQLCLKPNPSSPVSIPH